MLLWTVDRMIVWIGRVHRWQAWEMLAVAGKVERRRLIA